MVSLFVFCLFSKQYVKINIFSRYTCPLSVLGSFKCLTVTILTINYIGWIMVDHGGSWWIMVDHGGSWWIMVHHGGSWGIMVDHCGSGWIMGIRVHQGASGCIRVDQGGSGCIRVDLIILMPSSPKAKYKNQSYEKG